MDVTVMRGISYQELGSSLQYSQEIIRGEAELKRT
jgi:hypothetical protein